MRSVFFLSLSLFHSSYEYAVREPCYILIIADLGCSDIKLDNVLLDRRGGKLEAVLCDFELLKEETTIASDGTVTHVGGVCLRLQACLSIRI